MVLTSRGEIAVLAALGASSMSCANLLGLDPGSASEDGGSDAADPDGSPPVDGGPDASRGGGDGAVSVDAVDAPQPSPDGGCPYDTRSDPNHCGTCTHACPSGADSVPVCVSGTCSLVCDQGYVDCGGKPCSCGGGRLCLSDQTCGACRAVLQPCQLGTDCCSGTCSASLTCL
jgi:hypothetical protein